MNRAITVCVCVWHAVGSFSLPAGSFIGAVYHKLYTQSSDPEDGQNYHPLLLRVVNCPRVC